MDAQLADPALEPFSAWSGSRTPKILFVAEAFGRDEAAWRTPLIGASGRTLIFMLKKAWPDVKPDLMGALIRVMLSDFESYDPALGFAVEPSWGLMRHAWAEAAGVAFTNCFNMRPQDNDLSTLCARKSDLGADYPLPPLRQGQYLRPEHFGHLQRLRAELADSRPRLVVALGAAALWALTGSSAISSLRGTVTSTSDDAPIALVGKLLGDADPSRPPSECAGPSPVPQHVYRTLPTYHPAYVLRQHSARGIVIADLAKAWAEAHHEGPARPPRRVIVNPTLSEIRDWATRALAHACILACDTETARGQITQVNFAYGPDESLGIPFRGPTGAGSYWPDAAAELAAWNIVRLLLESRIEKLFQNGVYDLQFFMRMGIYPRQCVHDSMLLHHALYPEMQKGLGFLGSLLTREPAWKSMRKTSAKARKSAKKDD